MLHNTYGDISPRVGVKLAKRLLRVGQPLMVTQHFATMEIQEKNSGKIRKWRRYHSFPATTAPLAEGIAPAGHGLTYTDYTAPLQQFGDVTDLTDIIQDTHEDPVLKTMVTRSGEQYARVFETLTIDVIKGGTSVFYANGVTSRALVNSPVIRGDLRKVIRAFNRANATVISNIIAPTEKIATQGVEPGYYAMGHTDLDSDIRNITGFVPVVSYGNPGKAKRGERGAVEDTRFILTNMFDPWVESGLSGTTYLSNGAPVSVGAQCDVYPLIIVARDAYGVVRLQGRKAVNVSVLQPRPRGGDPLGQVGSVGWKTMFAAVILNEDWIARIECAATANPA